MEKKASCKYYKKKNREFHRIFDQKKTLRCALFTQLMDLPTQQKEKFHDISLNIQQVRNSEIPLQMIT